MTTASPDDTGRPALVLPDWDDAHHDATLITRMIRGLGERMICGASGENEDADLFVWLADRLGSCHERLDRALLYVPQPRLKGGEA